MDGALRHTPATAAGAKSAFFTGEGDKVFIATRLAFGPQESRSQDPALEILPELFFDEVRQRTTALLMDQP